jgi:hypothetical protein
MLRGVFQFILYCVVSALFYTLLDAPIWATVGFALLITHQLIPNKDEE